MKNILVGAALIAAALVAPGMAQASVFVFDFKGPGVSGTLNVSFEPNTNTGVLPQTAPNPVDPIGSYVVTGVGGTFSDASLGISDAAVTGLVPLNRVSPESANHLAPNSFSLLAVLHGVGSPDGLSPGLHYDNLLYPDGSPQTATDYPFAGGLFDIYGLTFTIAGGNVVNFWSNGAAPPNGLNYGVAVTDRIDLLDYVGGVSITAVPEPASWAMMVVGFGALGAAMRRGKARLSFG